MAWLVWPVILGLPPLVLVLRPAFGLHGLLTLVHLLVGVPVMWLVGMVLAVDADRADALTDLLTGTGETVIRLGHVTEGQGVRYTGNLA